MFTCWILLLLWTRLRARGCHCYKVGTLVRARPGHGKAPGGTVSEKILLQPCDWSVDLKLWWKRAERLSLAIAGWNAIYACHSEKCITFFHTALSTLSKAPLLQCYQNTSRGESDLCAFECDFQCPLHFSGVLFNCLSLSLPRSLWVTSRWPATLAHSGTEGRDTENISTQSGKSRNM